MYAQGNEKNTEFKTNTQNLNNAQDEKSRPYCNSTPSVYKFRPSSQKNEFHWNTNSHYKQNKPPITPLFTSKKNENYSGLRSLHLSNTISANSPCILLYSFSNIPWPDLLQQWFRRSIRSFSKLLLLQACRQPPTHRYLPAKR